MPVFWAGPVLAVGGFAARGPHGALPHWSLNAGTPPPAFEPVACAGFAPVGSTRLTPHRAHTEGCAGARPAHEAARLHSPCEFGPHDRESRRAGARRAWR